jgi:acyl-homoserine lactone acylase PvdQ
MVRRGIVGCRLAVFVIALALLAPAGASAGIQPYGLNDAGGFRNVLPPGEAGTDNAAQLARFQLDGTRPPHWDDQQPLYENLLYASPTLTDADVGKYFKDATFGVKPEDVASTEQPRPGVTIVRDKQYGVPHIYGDTAEDVEFGAGYAGAEDRLFLMDVLRHTGRAQLSSFIGGSPGNRQMDRTQWAIAPYSDADLQRQIDLAPTVYGDDGRQLVQRGNAFVDGINAYVDEATLNPNKMPGEYAAIGKLPTHWTLPDVIAEASLIGGIFGKGGGNEVRSALVLQALQKRLGDRAGARAWSDFRSKNDLEAPTTVKGTSFPYETGSAFAPAGLALPDPGSVQFTPVAPPVGGSGASASSASADSSVGGQLLRAFTQHPHASNWELVSASHSATGHPIGVLGPQVGYYVPQILMEEDLHGPGFDARGATFPGVNLMVQLGHGRDYAWSATTATSDNVDTFAEVLCQDDVHYLYKGQCLAMDKLDRTNSWSPSADDKTPPGSETLTAYRTVHGIVYARGTVGGKKVAFVSARTTYFHEADSAIGFFKLNDPAAVHDPQSFREAADGINFAFNWSYIDADHIAYQLSGWFPQRATGTSPDFPILGTGKYDWQGYDPSLHTMSTVGMDQRPHAVDPAYLVSWNNKQAPGWAAADDKYSYGPIFRSQMIEQRVKDAIAGGKKMTLAQLVQAMEEPASQDLEAWSLMPILRRAIGQPSNPKLRKAFDDLIAWAAAGAHRRDLDREGTEDEGDRVALMDAWWPRLVKTMFAPAIGDDAYQRLSTVLRPASVLPGDPPSAPDYDDGWWGYVSKDLRDIYDRKRVVGWWSRTYCGGGSKSACRSALLASLADALDHSSRKELYGKGDCASNPDPACYDQNRPTVASGVDMPAFPFQNRPTFQQTVSVSQHVAR